MRLLFYLSLSLRLRLSLRPFLILLSSLRLSLRPFLSLSLRLSLYFSLSLKLSAQTYSSIQPMSEVQPYNLHLSGDMVGMNSAVQTPDGYLWIGSTKGLIISDGHTSVMYSRDNPMFPLVLDDSGAFLGDLHLDSLGSVYASVSTGAKIIRFDMASRTIAEEWNFEEQSKASFIQFDVSPQGDVYILLVEKSTDNFIIWKLNAHTQTQLVFQGTKAT